jgi:predicted nucleotidyltransferase
MQVNSIKSIIVTVLKKHQIAKAAIFGSYARNEATNDSDIDLLIETNQPITLFDVLRLEKELAKATSKKVDIVEFSAIKKSIRENILRDAILIL